MPQLDVRVTRANLRDSESMTSTPGRPMVPPKESESLAFVFGAGQRSSMSPSNSAPDAKAGFTRRAILATASGGALSAGTWLWLRQRGLAVDAPEVPPVAPSNPPPPTTLAVAFDPRAERTMEAVVSMLLPGSATLGIPSAREAGVMGFLGRNARLDGLRPLRNQLVKLTRYLDRAAADLRAQRTASFGDLDAAESMQVLLTASQDTKRVGSFHPPEALEATLRIALEAYLSHPYHGGNQGFVAWTALGIEMPKERSPKLGHHHD